MMDEFVGLLLDCEAIFGIELGHKMFLELLTESSEYLEEKNKRTKKLKEVREVIRKKVEKNGKIESNI